MGKIFGYYNFPMDFVLLRTIRFCCPPWELNTTTTPGWDLVWCCTTRPTNFSTDSKRERQAFLDPMDSAFWTQKMVYPELLCVTGTKIRLDSYRLTGKREQWRLCLNQS